MTKKDLKILVVLWVIGIILAYITRVLYDAAYDARSAAGPGPASIEHGITQWISLPASTTSEKVRTDVSWMIMVIMPFLYAPMMTLGYIILRFRKDRQPVPDKPRENLKLEVAWTIIPALVLVAMAVPAYDALIYMQTKPVTPDQVVNVTGAQFFWQYEFPRYGINTTDNGTITMIKGTDKAVEEDSWLHLPVNKSVLMNGQSFQVNHAWWVPAFGLKFDVIPGRVTTGWFHTTKKGYFKGQCAELCGALHSFMWIHVKVVDDKDFYQWVLNKGGKIPAEEEPTVIALLGEDYRERYVPKDAEPAAFPTAPATPTTAPAPAAGATPPGPHGTAVPSSTGGAPPPPNATPSAAAEIKTTPK